MCQMKWWFLNGARMLTTNISVVDLIYAKTTLWRFRVSSLQKSYRWKRYGINISRKHPALIPTMITKIIFDTAFIDSTVQEKNITYPTDAKLHKKIIKNVLKIVHDKSLPLRQSYTRTLKGIYRSPTFFVIIPRIVRKLLRQIGNSRP